MELARSANRDGGAPGNAEEEIKKRAYEIWEQAEQELRKRG
jgi:hypothetical protein